MQMGGGGEGVYKTELTCFFITQNKTECKILRGSSSSKPCKIQKQTINLAAWVLPERCVRETILLDLEVVCCPSVDNFILVRAVCSSDINNILFEVDGEPFLNAMNEKWLADIFLTLMLLNCSADWLWAVFHEVWRDSVPVSEWSHLFPCGTISLPEERQSWTTVL